ncbi:MAG: cytochrome P450 [Marinicaulis sp.]|nr:cytochrome P450 [Marinicaulis sp.]
MTPSSADIILDKINVADIDLWDTQRFWPFFERLRRDDPVHYCADSAYGPYWSITSYEDILAIEANHRVFSSASKHGGVIIHDDLTMTFGNYVLEGIITMDPPRHQEQRAAVSGIVARPNLAHFETIIRERTARVFNNLPIDQTFDWVEMISVELTTQMLATLLDFPFEDRHMLTRWSNIATTEPGQGIIISQEQRIKEFKECLFYFTKLWRERKQKTGGFDLISMLSQNPATAKMNPMNFLGNVLVLIVGGNDTTRNSMTGSLVAFQKFPEELEKLKKNPALLDNAVSEIIRWHTPIAHMRRTALEDFELRGKKIRKGDKVVMWYVSGNRDETIFKNADVFDIERENARRHLAFGFGIHRCMGRGLAELQLKIFLTELLKYIDRVEIMHEPERPTSNFVHGYSSLPVRIAREI